jgi:hypothetical protein
MSRLQVDDFGHALGLRGSPLRDTFTYAHKARLGPGYWATDVDLVLVEKDPPGIVAYLDCKRPNEPVSFAEALAYNKLQATAPVFVIEVRDAEWGPFTVSRYVAGDWHRSPPTVRLEPVRECADWEALGVWERSLREDYRRAKALPMGEWPGLHDRLAGIRARNWWGA